MQSLNDSRNWFFEDPRPEESIDTIHPLSVRALALLRRSRSPLLHTNFVQIAGAASILSGIEYHYTRFLESVPQIRVSPQIADMAASRHEAVAWINRVGQYYAFKRCALVQSVVAELATPSMDEVVRFRNKHTAHRSIDAPRPEDTDHLQLMQAMCLSDLGGSMWKKRAGIPVSQQGLPTHATHLLCFQMKIADGEWFDLVIEEEHYRVMAEAYGVFERLLRTD